MATVDTSVGDGWALQSHTPRTMSPSSHAIPPSTTTFNPDVGVFDNNRNRRMSGATLVDYPDNDSWTPHAHVDGYALLTGWAPTPQDFHENSPANTDDQSHAHNVRRDSVMSQESDGDDGWNGRDAPGLDLIDRRPDTALEATLRAGEAARARRGYPYPPSGMTENFTTDYGNAPMREPQPEDSQQITHTTIQREHISTAISKSTQKLKGLFRRLFKSEQQWG